MAISKCTSTGLLLGGVVVLVLGLLMLLGEPSVLFGSLTAVGLLMTVVGWRGLATASGDAPCSGARGSQSGGPGR
ncbi:MAG: hypothetical protein U9Q81_07410 [Pseudomonadota bacterium]|nr:hypothetical protein [Pseudomonadota bacterium]